MKPGCLTPAVFFCPQDTFPSIQCEYLVTTPHLLISTFVVLRSDPVRPFISGHVANSMAAEVIALLHSLLTAPESNTAQIWTSTAEKVSYFV